MNHDSQFSSNGCAFDTFLKAGIDARPHYVRESVKVTGMLERKNVRREFEHHTRIARLDRDRGGMR